MSRRASAETTHGDRSAADWMHRALSLTTATRPHPNPRVGAIVLDAEGQVVAKSAHDGPGQPHAEAAALAIADDRALGGTLVVTLEPCNHQGLTPPCTDAVLGSGVSTVIVGITDPDPRVAGSGIKRLQEAGLDVTVLDELSPDVVAADPGYFHHRKTGRPRVTLKLAATLDGQTAAVDGTSQWITSPEARNDAHRLRAASDAVIIGAGTLRIDDPLLDVRLDGYDGPQPTPVVIAGWEPLPATARLYERNPLIYAPQRFAEAPPGSEIEILWHPTGVDLEAMLKDLGGRGIVDVLVEGGATLAGALLRAGLVDALVVYLAGKLAAGLGRPMFDAEFRTLTDARSLTIDETTLIGPDLRIDATPEDA